MRVSVCKTCSADGNFVDVVRAGLPDFKVDAVECMSGCTRPQTIAFRATGKTAYLFGDISAEDIAELRSFATLYAASDDGTFPDARVLGNLRTKAIARIPG